jgi:autophagy-related protein 18
MSEARDRLVLVMETKIHIYEIANMKLLYSIDTSPNPQGLTINWLASCHSSMLPSIHPSIHPCSHPSVAHMHCIALCCGALMLCIPGICALSSSSESLIAYPESEDTGGVVLFDGIQLEVLSTIRAHKTAITNLAIDSKANLLATTSVRGTIVRVFDIGLGSKYQTPGYIVCATATATVTQQASDQQSVSHMVMHWFSTDTHCLLLH